MAAALLTDAGGHLAMACPPDPLPRGDSRARVTAAALRCVTRFGLAKTTVDDIAREAGISRATLYRLCPGGRDEVVSGMVANEVGEFFDRVADAMAGLDDLEERLVAAMTTAADQLSSHAALGVLLAHEPEARVLPLVSFSGLDRVLEIAGSFLEPYLADDLGGEDARRVGEWVTRLLLSHVACPAGAAAAPDLPSPVRNSFRGAVGTPFALHPETLGQERARYLVRQFVMPGIGVLRRPASKASPEGPLTTAGGTTKTEVTARDRLDDTEELH